MSIRDIVFGGISAGCVLHLKFNSLGFYFGWVLAVIILIIISKEENKVKRFLLSAVAYLAGILAVTLPFLIYFLVNGAVGDWIRCCLYTNIFLYSESIPLGERIYRMIKFIYNQMMCNKRYSVFIAIGFIGGFFRAFKRRDREAVLSCISVYIMFGGLATGIFFGGFDLPYYPLPMSMFAVLGFAILGMMKDGVFGKENDEGTVRMLPRKLWIIGSAVAIVASICICFFGSMNVAFMEKKQEDLFQFRMRDYIESTGIQNPTLINIGYYDAGLYTLLDAVPECYFYQTTTIAVPGVWETQSEYVKNEHPDFILGINGYLDFDTSDYDVVMEETDDGAGDLIVYWLYQRRHHDEL